MKRAASSETVRYPSEPQAKAKAKAKARASSRASSNATIRYPSEDRVVLPTIEEAERTGVALSKVEKKVLKTPKAELNAMELAASLAAAKPKKASKKPVIRMVRIAGPAPNAAPKKPRGRPQGAVGKLKRDKAALEALEMA